MATDVDLYEASLDGPKMKADPSPELTEVDLPTSLLMTIAEQLQVITHVAARAKGRPKISRVPRPKTAEDLYQRAQTRRAYEHLESVITYVPTEEFLSKNRLGRG